MVISTKPYILNSFNLLFYENKVKKQEFENTALLNSNLGLRQNLRDGFT
jgi:hypothetical protein